MKSLGRLPRLEFTAGSAVNDDNATPGRDFYIQGKADYPITPLADIGSEFYALELVHFAPNGKETRVLFTEREAHAVAALLNGLQLGLLPEHKKRVIDCLEQQYKNVEMITFTVPCQPTTDYEIPKPKKRRSRK